MANGVLKPYFFDSLLIPYVLTHVSAISTASAAIVVALATIATVTPVERITVGGVKVSIYYSARNKIIRSQRTVKSAYIYDRMSGTILNKQSEIGGRET